jgi:hypothetical protein
VRSRLADDVLLDPGDGNEDERLDGASISYTSLKPQVSLLVVAWSTGYDRQAVPSGLSYLLQTHALNPRFLAPRPYRLI